VGGEHRHQARLELFEALRTSSRSMAEKSKQALA
jgi:hypothetical protein